MAAYVHDSQFFPRRTVVLFAIVGLLLNISFPHNVILGLLIGAFAEGNILQVLFISVLCGFALVQLGERAAPLVQTPKVAGVSDKFTLEIKDFVALR